MRRITEIQSNQGDVQVPWSFPIQPREEEELVPSAAKPVPSGTKEPVLPVLQKSSLIQNHPINTTLDTTLALSILPSTLGQTNPNQGNIVSPLAPRALVFSTSPNSPIEPHPYLASLDDLPPRSSNPQPQSHSQGLFQTLPLPTPMDFEPSLRPINLSNARISTQSEPFLSREQVLHQLNKYQDFDRHTKEAIQNAQQVRDSLIPPNTTFPPQMSTIPPFRTSFPPSSTFVPLDQSLWIEGPSIPPPQEHTCPHCQRIETIVNNFQNEIRCKRRCEASPPVEGVLVTSGFKLSNDMIITGDDCDEIKLLNAELSYQFAMKDLGLLGHFLSIEVASSTKDGDPLPDPSLYRTIVGSLVYLTVTPPNITYVVHIVSKFVIAPTTVHWAVVLEILRYLRDVLSKSSTEAKYRAMAVTTSEVVWLRWLLADMGVHITSPTPLYCDNRSAIQIARNTIFHERTKHIEIDCYFTSYHLQVGIISLSFVPSALH
ncbi:uncharacterized mitochondrial protein-like protein [Tanacetum coccineum]